MVNKIIFQGQQLKSIPNIFWVYYFVIYIVGSVLDINVIFRFSYVYIVALTFKLDHTHKQKMYYLMRIVLLIYNTVKRYKPTNGHTVYCIK